MIHEFISIDQFITSFEPKLMNLLYDYNLLDKFNLDVKKVILHLFVLNFNNKITNRKLLFYHNHILADNHELLKYYNKDKLNIFINKVCAKLKKTTNRLFFITNKKPIPSWDFFDKLDGEIQDEIILLRNNENPDPKKLKEFLHTCKLEDLFDNLNHSIV